MTVSEEVQLRITKVHSASASAGHLRTSPSKSTACTDHEHVDGSNKESDKSDNSEHGDNLSSSSPSVWIGAQDGR